MYTNFGGGGLLGFEDIASFKFDQIPFLTVHDSEKILLFRMGSKNLC